MQPWDIDELRRREGTHRTARKVAAVTVAGMFAGGLAGALGGEGSAAAMPKPTYYMKDINQFSSTHFPAPANAAVIEGGSMSTADALVTSSLKLSTRLCVSLPTANQRQLRL